MIMANVNIGQGTVIGSIAAPERLQPKAILATEESIKNDFASLVDPHQDALFAGALQFTGNRADAEDLLQETFMRAYIGFKRSQEIEKPRAWLFKIMRNAYINRYHKKRRQPTKVSYEEGLDHKVDEIFSHTQADPQDAFFSQFLDKEIEEALDSLPEQFRESVVLCDISGLSYEEIIQRPRVSARHREVQDFQGPRAPLPQALRLRKG